MVGVMTMVVTTSSLHGDRQVLDFYHGFMATCHSGVYVSKRFASLLLFFLSLLVPTTFSPHPCRAASSSSILPRLLDSKSCTTLLLVHCSCVSNVFLQSIFIPLGSDISSSHQHSSASLEVQHVQSAPIKHDSSFLCPRLPQQHNVLSQDGEVERLNLFI